MLFRDALPEIHAPQGREVRDDDLPVLKKKAPTQFNLDWVQTQAGFLHVLPCCSMLFDALSMIFDAFPCPSWRSHVSGAKKAAPEAATDAKLLDWSCSDNQLHCRFQMPMNHHLP